MQEERKKISWQHNATLHNICTKGLRKTGNQVYCLSSTVHLCLIIVITGTAFSCFGWWGFIVTWFFSLKWTPTITFDSTHFKTQISVFLKSATLFYSNSDVCTQPWAHSSDFSVLNQCWGQFSNYNLLYWHLLAHLIRCIDNLQGSGFVFVFFSIRYLCVCFTGVKLGGIKSPSVSNKCREFHKTVLKRLNCLRGRCL